MKQALVLDQKLRTLVKSERKITYEILLVVQAIDITGSYREFGYPSLKKYLIKEMGYSQGAAERRIASAKLMKQVPVIENDLQSGKLNLTQVSLAQSAIRQEEKAQGEKMSQEQKIELLDQLKTKTTFETQRILKENCPHFEIPKQTVFPTGDKKIQVNMEFTEVDWEKIQELKAHFSHTVSDQKLESLLLYWHAQVQNKKQKQKERAAQKAAEHAANVEPSAEATAEPSRSTAKPQWCCETPKKANKYRDAIPVADKIQVREKAQDQCEYVSPLTNKRCCSKHYLDIEHIIPIAKGGTNDLRNLRLFCRSHNALAAKEWGISWCN
jgi:5-methylcytosine-specific restriction endonuclease McrA